MSTFIDAPVEPTGDVAVDVTDNIADGGRGAPPHIPEIKREEARNAVRDLLAALGQDVADPELEETPRRVADGLTEMLSPKPFALTTFENTDDYDEMVVVRDIPVRSLCAHHLLPFTGVAHVAYVPGDAVVGLSKLARAVELFSRGLQMQERLTVDIARWLQQALAPQGVGVLIEAEHTCMTIRGANAHGAKTVTSSLTGVIRTDPSSRAEFMSLAR